MAGDADTERAKAAFRARFREEKIGLVYARTRGGEARSVSHAEALGLIHRFEEAVDRAAARVKIAVLASLLLVVLLGFLAVHFRMLALVMLAVASLFSGVAVFMLSLWQRWRLEQSIWASLERRAGMAALSREEKIRRGYAAKWWQWLLTIPLIAVVIFFQAPGDMFPERLHVLHAAARVLLLVGGGIALVVMGAVRLVRRMRGPN